MALITTIEELKKHHPFTITFEMEDVSPFIRTIEKYEIVKLLGNKEYNALQAAYDKNLATPTKAIPPKYKALLAEVRDVIAPLVASAYLPFAQAKQSQSGLVVVNTEDFVSAPKWMSDKYEVSAYDRGMQAVDYLLEFLEENKTTYTDWAKSGSYTVFKENFINSVSEFQKSGVHINNSRRLFLKMIPNMQRVEEFSIKPILFDKLFAELKKQILENKVSGLNKELLKFIRPAIANITISESIDELALIFDEKGFALYENAQGDDPKRKAVALEQLQQLKNSKERIGKNYLNQLQNYLDKNVAQYPLYFNSPSYKKDEPTVYENDPCKKIAAFL